MYICQYHSILTLNTVVKAYIKTDLETFKNFNWFGNYIFGRIEGVIPLPDEQTVQSCDKMQFDQQRPHTGINSDPIEY